MCEHDNDCVEKKGKKRKENGQQDKVLGGASLLSAALSTGRTLLKTTVCSQWSCLAEIGLEGSVSSYFRSRSWLACTHRLYGSISMPKMGNSVCHL